MACDIITTGVTLSCTRGNNIGGVASVWLASYSTVSAVTEIALTHIVTGVTMTSGAYKFYKYDKHIYIFLILFNFVFLYFPQNLYNYLLFLTLYLLIYLLYIYKIAHH